VTKQYTVGDQQRLTIWIQGEDPRLAQTAVSTIVESTNHQPVVVERAMWWPKGQWYETHLPAGAVMTGARRALADSEVSTSTETSVLLANTSAVAGSATVTLLLEGHAPVQTTVTLAASSRVNVPVSTMLAGLPITDTPWRFGRLVERTGLQLVVERAMYTSANGQVWTPAPAALGTKVP
jgi:hypothetical protein